MENFGAQTLPHEAKELRKQILSAREMLDLFAYSFQDGKMYDFVRSTLDNGYEAVGHFKDLYDVQQLSDPKLAVYNDDLLKSRRKEVLDWKKDFLSQQENFFDYIKNVLTKGAADHKRKDLSLQFWGSSNHRPRVEQKAQYGIGVLLTDLWKTAQKEYVIVRKIKHPGLDYENIETFHDFRKRVRSALKIIQYFDELSAAAKPSHIKVLTEMVELYGEISDLVAKMDLSIEEKKRKSAQAAREEIKTKWDEIQNWEKEQDIKQILEEIAKTDFAT